MIGNNIPEYNPFLGLRYVQNFRYSHVAIAYLNAHMYVYMHPTPAPQLEVDLSLTAP